MRAMKDSGIEWIGQIPRAWQVVRVKHLATQKDSLFLDGDWINSDVITTEGIRYLTSGNVGEGTYKEQGNGHISEETFEKQNCLKAFPGDLMISRLNEPVGRCCIIPEGHPFYVVAVDNVILRPDDGYNKKFIMYCMNTQGYAHAALMAASGTTMVRISRTSLGNLTIPVASVEEQKRIVEYLDTKCAEIDALIAAKEKTNALLKERRQSIIYEAVTKGLNPEAPMKDSGIEWIGEIPEHWTVKKIKYLGTFRNGLTYSPDNVTNEESGTLVLRSSNIQNGNVVFDDNVYVDMDIPEILQVAAGDILICSRNGSRELIGKNAIIPENVKASFGAFMMIFRCGDPKYLYYILNSNVFSYYLGTFLTSTVNQLTAANFGNMKVVYCDSAEEREEIVAHLDQKCEELDAAISTNEATIQKLKEYRQSIIYEAVTGKIEV